MTSFAPLPLLETLEHRAIRGIVDTLDARLDDVPLEEIERWAVEIGADAFYTVSGALVGAEIFFQVLADEGSEAAENAIWDYDKQVGRYVDNAEDAFLDWYQDRLLTAPLTRGPRSRPSGLSERQLVIA